MRRGRGLPGTALENQAPHLLLPSHNIPLLMQKMLGKHLQLA